MARQLLLDLPKWGGRRAGAGRPRTRPHPGLDGPGVPHLRRPDFPSRVPVHVTQRLQPGVGYLRGYRRARLIEQALRDVREQVGVRVIHYSIQGNHLHLIVEADTPAALSRGMQGFAIRLARRLNALLDRKGAVFADRYHSRPLETPREVAFAVRYVLEDHRHHARERFPARWEDPLSSAQFLRCAPADDSPVVAPRTWLLRVGWRRRKP